jgi:DNA-binding protein Fis
MAVVKIKEEAMNCPPFLVELNGERLRESIRQALRNYFSQLKGEEPERIYPIYW